MIQDALFIGEKNAERSGTRTLLLSCLSYSEFWRRSIFARIAFNLLPESHMSSRRSTSTTWQQRAKEYLNLA